eukprot:CAMPEP_0198137814 /NCGR_PEP_ID=MMETSP1443-20131203/1268_1 /TAXON_ID=186043 /ORGANISM="Entomoneis sp., Strain CCMP2396" /LENGTH=548 /DNA_ID=CAMNT_0043799371 /DNA_START=277 /DNA_END=1923 /DNA_ORIENTATION=-
MLDGKRDELTQIQDVMRDEENKKALVLDLIGSKCTSDSPFEKIREIAAVLELGESILDGQFISGGKNNYCFKIFIDTDRSLALYAKLFLPYALWDEDGTFQFDIKRAVSEYDLMCKLKESDATGSLCATPFYVLDVKGGNKLLIAEWASETDEQWGNQFVDGQVDMRVVTKFAQGMAQLNLQEVDYVWGDFVRPGLVAMSPVVKSLLSKVDPMGEDINKADDPLLLMLKEVGEVRYAKMVDLYCEQLKEDRQVLCHNDIHPFNILVEPKPMEEGQKGEDGEQMDSSPVMDQFGPAGSFLICDWETAICGPAGRDAGVFMAFPSACALAFAVQGHTEEAQHLVDCNMEFWDSYANVLKTEGGKTEHDILTIYRVALGNMGTHQLINFHILGLQEDLLPLNGVPEADVTRAKTSIGLVGLKLMLLSFDDSLEETANMDIDGLKEYYKKIMAEQIEILTVFSVERKPLKKPSFLRALARRVSDASTHEEATTRYSNKTLDFSNHKRLSIFESMDFGSSMASFVDDGGDLFDMDDFEVTDEIKRQWEEDLED